MIALTEAQEWMRRGHCRPGQLTNPDIMYPDEYRESAMQRLALEVCNGYVGTVDGVQKQLSPPCPVREQCLRYSVEQDMFWGVWGGKMPQDRAADQPMRVGKRRNCRVDGLVFTPRNNSERECSRCRRRPPASQRQRVAMIEEVL